jgi:three-Cys-motif partner protein
VERRSTPQAYRAGIAVRFGVKKKKAADGLLARTGGIWTREKLTYLEKYASAFMTAMGSKRTQGRWERLVYIDLLAGPGLDIDAETNREFNGSPLIALAVRPKFDHLYLADKDSKNISALKARIPAEDRNRVTIMQGDCNALVAEVLKQISTHTLGLAFVDPQGFEVHFDTLAKLAKRRIDLLYLFPSAIGLRRNWKQALTQSDSKIDKFWGDGDWRQLPILRQIMSGVQKKDTENIISSFVSAFLRKLGRTGFQYRDEATPPFSNRKNAQMYHLLYCSQDPVGLKIWNGIKQIGPGGQRKLL